MSPSASLATGVDPDADSSGTGPLKDINVSGRASSSKASLSKGVESDTARADTVSPGGSNVTEGEIPPTASLLLQVNPATVQTEAEPQGRVDHVRSTTEEIVTLQMISNLGAMPNEGLASSPGQQVTEARTEDVTDNRSDETLVATVTLDTTSEEDNAASPPRALEDELGSVMSPALSPSNPKDSHSAAPSQTLSQIHTAFNSHLRKLVLSSLGGQPPGHTPPTTPAGEPLVKIDLTGSKVDPPMPKTIPASATPSGVLNRTQDSNPPIFKSPNIIGSAFRVIGKVKSAMGMSSKKSTSSKSKGTRRSGFISWGRARVPQMVSFAPSTALVRKTKGDSRLSPDDSVTFTYEDDTVARPTPTGDVPTILIGETTSDTLTSPNSETTSGVTVSHANKVPSEVQTSHEGQTRVTPDLLVKRLLTKPKAPISQPDPSPPPAPGSIEGISSITHTSSSDATSSNGTSPFWARPVLKMALH